MPRSTAEISPEVRERLLEAWRGEIVAGRVYDLIAERMPAREADILRRMAAAEGGHRERLEARMTELGIPIPPADSVHLSPWLRLQARIAPVDRLLAAREAAEDEEVGDLYKRSTGDPVTDELLRGIRKEERAHSHTVSEMRTGIADGDGAAEAPVHPAQARLDKILGREKWHRTGGGWISGAIYGANDGLAAVFGIVAGVSGATGGSSFVLTAGRVGRRRLGPVDGDRRVPRRAIRGRGRRRQHRARAAGDRRAPRGGTGGAVALLPVEGNRRGDRGRDGGADSPSSPTRC